MSFRTSFFKLNNIKKYCWRLLVLLFDVEIKKNLRFVYFMDNRYYFLVFFAIVFCTAIETRLWRKWIFRCSVRNVVSSLNNIFVFCTKCKTCISWQGSASWNFKRYYIYREREKLHVLCTCIYIYIYFSFI